jgi:purine-binding chemotaxis protein CheW
MSIELNEMSTKKEAPAAQGKRVSRTAPIKKPASKVTPSTRSTATAANVVTKKKQAQPAPSRSLPPTAASPAARSNKSAAKIAPIHEPIRPASNVNKPLAQASPLENLATKSESQAKPAAEVKPVYPPTEQTPAPSTKGEKISDGETSEQLVVFTLGSESFGLNISAVESIIKMQSITPIPHTSHYVLGVTNLRGTVLPVIDLRKRFEMPGEQTTNDPRIMVVLIKGEKVGLLVDSVSEVLRIPKSAIELPPPMVSTIGTEFITGIAKFDSKLVILLDLVKILYK